MDTHCRRWPRLLAQAAEDPGRIVPGAESAVVLTRGQADRLQQIVFDTETPSGLRRTAV
jgi:hypothetical protein